MLINSYMLKSAKKTLKPLISEIIAKQNIAKLLKVKMSKIIAIEFNKQNSSKKLK